MYESIVRDEYERRRTDLRVDTYAHMPFLHNVVLTYPHPVVIEIGVASGNTTSALLSAVEIQGGKLYSCDIATREQLENWAGDQIKWWRHPQWSFISGDSLSEDVLHRMPGKCDVLFIDGDHTREHVLNELRAYAPRVTPGGIIMLHDTQYHPGGDRDSGHPDGEVAEAIRAYCKEAGLSWVNRAGSYGLGLIRK